MKGKTLKISLRLAPCPLLGTGELPAGTRKGGRPIRLRATLSALLAMLLLSTGVANASNHVRTVVTFDAAAGELPEGVAVDKRGNIFVSLVVPVSEIRKIRPDGSQSVLAEFPTTGLGPLGLAVDPVGNLYVGLVSFDPSTQGVYKVSPNGNAVRLPGTASIGFANGLAFDDRGDLFVTDSIVGAVWRIPWDGSAELWLQDPLLVGTGDLGAGFPIGANGIAVLGRSVIVANSEQGTLVRVPLRRNGDAGIPSVMVEDRALLGADGLALGATGDVFVAVIVQSTVVHVQGGVISTVADAADGLNEVSSISFGNGRAGPTTMYAVNFGAFSPTPTPSLLAIAVGVPGRPMP
jgi:sugar lactone lactonase YvrE